MKDDKLIFNLTLRVMKVVYTSSCGLPLVYESPALHCLLKSNPWRLRNLSASGSTVYDW